jgi:hypothetical protein
MNQLPGFIAAVADFATIPAQPSRMVGLPWWHPWTDRFRWGPYPTPRRTYPQKCRDIFDAGPYGSVMTTDLKRLVAFPSAHSIRNARQ